MEPKSAQQIKCESGYYFGDWRPTPERRRITAESKWSPCKVGEMVTVKRWGTFGCWDTKNRWVDFYNSEPVVIMPSRMWLFLRRLLVVRFFVWMFTGKYIRVK
jgi:hypothetical protein